MFTERFFVEGLAHASYLFGANGAAAVVDPKRDIYDYIAAAERQGAKIVAIFETHLHSDFVSGHVELAQRTGATIYLSKRLAGARFAHRGLAHGEEVAVGPLRVRALETPGHSPDSLSFYVDDGAGTRLVYSGDTLFVGDVGRPDLRVGTADPEAMAEALFDSLHQVLFGLPDDTQVFPAHGAGSLWGRRIGDAPASTIGQEKRTNWASRFHRRDDFVAAVTADMPDRPAYLPSAVVQNLRGALPLLLLSPRPQQMEPEELREVFPDRVVLDTRSAARFGAGHIAGSLSVGIESPLFSHWVGCFVASTARIVLVADSPGAARQAWIELTRIGFDIVVGYLLPDEAAWKRAGLTVRVTPQADVCDLERWVADGKALLDVRARSEWDDGHVAGATWMPLPRLLDQMVELDDEPIAVLSGTGYSSSLATSLLERAGHRQVANVPGGWAAWSHRRCPECEPLDRFRDRR